MPTYGVCSVCGRERQVHRSRTTGNLRCASCRVLQRYYVVHPGAVAKRQSTRDTRQARNKEIAAWYQAGWSSSELGYAFDLTGRAIIGIVTLAGVVRSRKEAALSGYRKRGPTVSIASRNAAIVNEHEGGA